MKFLKSKWFVPIAGALGYFLTMALLWKPLPPAPEELEAVHARTNRVPVLTGPSWNFYNPEMDQLVNELKKEREELAVRRQQLEELATRLQTERLELNQLTQAVHQMQVEFDKNFLRVREEETANLKKLAKIYSTMEAGAAVKVLQELDDAVLVKIMVFMKDNQTGPILEALSKLGDDQAKRAAQLSERIRLSVFRNGSEKTKS